MNPSFPLQPPLRYQVEGAQKGDDDISDITGLLAKILPHSIKQRTTDHNGEQ